MAKRLPHSNTTTKNTLVSKQAKIVITEDRKIVRRTGGKVTEEEYQQALHRLACGDTIKNVTQDLGVSRAALQVRAYENEDFRQRLMVATQMGAWARLENAENALWAGDLSTGEIQRDKAIAEHARWMASRLDRPTFGEKIDVDHRQITINIDGGKLNGDPNDLC